MPRPKNFIPLKQRTPSIWALKRGDYAEYILSTPQNPLRKTTTRLPLSVKCRDHHNIKWDEEHGYFVCATYDHQTSVPIRAFEGGTSLGRVPLHVVNGFYRCNVAPKSEATPMLISTDEFNTHIQPRLLKFPPDKPVDPSASIG